MIGEGSDASWLANGWQGELEMQTISRRQFLGGSAMDVAAAGYLSGGALQLRADPLGIPIGCQVFPVRLQLVQDFDGTVRDIYAAGYRVIEFCSPPGFVTMDMAPLVGMKASEIRQKVEAAGLRTVSCHYQFKELKENVDQRIAFAKELGLDHMIVATYSVPRDGTMDDWRRAAEETNKLGEKTRKAGMQLGYHNHGFEFRQIGGELIFDELMKRWDRKLVKSQFQVSDAVSLGFDPAAILTKYPGRFLSLHLQDWSAATKRAAPVGQGSIDWKQVFTAAKKGGIKYYFVEMNMEALKASYPYLHALKV
jgi:sugar phosphate isomerase/epimerase